MLGTWIATILTEKAADIYRMKGVISVAYAEQKFVYQGVHVSGHTSECVYGSRSVMRSFDLCVAAFVFPCAAR